MGSATNWQSISCGSNHTIATKTDSTIWVWGSNSYSQMGNGQPNSILSPTQIGTGSKWQNAAAGATQCFAIKSDGTLWAWGRNNYGQLGDSTIVNKVNPTKIGISTNWKTIMGANPNTFGLKNDGSLWGWGQNASGEYGNGTNTSKLVPTLINCPFITCTPTSSTTNLSICPSQLPYTWNGLIFTAADTKTKTGLTNAAGCDSSATLVLSVYTVAPVSFTALAPIYNIAAAAVTLTGSPIGGTFSGPGISGNVFTPSVAGAGGPYTITYLYTNGNSCSNSTTQQITVASCAVTATPGGISTVGGAATICPGDTKTYSIVAVAGATSYSWTSPTGGNITTGQGTSQITINYSSGFSASSVLKVVANNACGFSAARSLTITRNTPTTPSVVTGLAYGVCKTSGVAYSVNNVVGRTFNWSFDSAKATVASGQGTNAITANFLNGFKISELRVTASNACGISAERVLTIKATPAAPTAITGVNSICVNQTSVPYSIAPVNTATLYLWTAPTGSHISDGVTTSAANTLSTTSTSVSINFGSIAGNVTVKAKNFCGTGSNKSMPISIVCFAKGEDASTKKISATEIKANEIKAKLSPNPTTTGFKLSVQSESKEVIQITVFDNEGKRIQQLKTTNLNNIILCEKYTSGSYLFEVRQGEKRKTVTGVKQ